MDKWVKLTGEGMICSKVGNKIICKVQNTAVNIKNNLYFSKPYRAIYLVMSSLNACLDIRLKPHKRPWLQTLKILGD